MLSWHYYCSSLILSAILTAGKADGSRLVIDTADKECFDLACAIVVVLKDIEKAGVSDGCKTVLFIGASP